MYFCSLILVLIIFIIFVDKFYLYLTFTDKVSSRSFFGLIFAVKFSSKFFYHSDVFDKIVFCLFCRQTTLTVIKSSFSSFPSSAYYYFYYDLHDDAGAKGTLAGVLFRVHLTGHRGR